ncbi:MAG TPA: rod shape-determining protein MreC [Planctomycetota bacterium]|nr:rod shape-determining protein MreC [Planctomycetota bacterium]
MQRRRGSLAAGPLAAAAMALMALPAAWTQPPRLALSSVLSVATLPAASFGRRFSGGSTPAAAELLQQLELEKSKNLELSAANARLREQLEALNAGRATVKDPKLTFIPAGIVLSTDSSQWRRTFIIDKGTRHGMARGMPVLWHNHLLGFIVEPGLGSSRVALITDPKIAVGAMAVARSAEGAARPSRDLCILEGTGAASASLKWASSDATAGDGATVVTSPDPARGVPEGLLLGRVTGVSRSRGPFARPQVQPFVDLRGVDSVLVLVKVEDTR